MPSTGSRPAPRFLALATLTLVGLTALPQPGRADPAAETLRVVPSGTSICLVLRDLRSHARAISGSPFAAWLGSSPLGRRLADPKELEKLRALERFLTEQLGVTAEQLLDDILGDMVILAYLPGPPGQPDKEAGLVLLHARNPELLARLVDKLNELQRKSGEITAVREKTHQGATYFEREKAAGGSEYYYLRGPLLAFSSVERPVHEVISLSLAPPPRKPGRVQEGIARLGLSTTLAVCWFDPRAFDAELTAKARSTADPAEQAFLTQFFRVWTATDGFALYAQPNRGLELGFVAAVDRSKLPGEVRGFLEPSKGSALGSAVPEEAFFAVAGRLDVPGFLRAIGSFLPPEGQASLKAAIDQGVGPLVGRDKLPAVLAGLGPDWAFWVTPPDPAARSWMPDWTVALKLSEDPRSGVDVPRTVLQAADFAAQMLRVAYNRDHDDQIDLGEERQGEVLVKVLANEKGFPPGFRPAYALKGGYLVVSSSPDGIRRFQPPTGKDAASDQPLLRISAKHLRGYLKNQGRPLAANVARWSNKPVQEVERELDNLGLILEAFNRVEVRQSVEEGKYRLTVRYDLVQPLK